MPFDDLQSYVRHLESIGELKRVRAEVDPVLEVTEIVQRVVQEDGPALLFERPKGARYPLVINLFGSMRRIREALGREPAEIGEELLTTIRRINPPTLRGLWESRSVLRRGLGMRPRRVSAGTAQSVVEKPDLEAMPVLQCWPEDAGRFLTYGMTLTEHPVTRRRNFGLYRLQVFDKARTGMHWQSMKGGRGHYWEAEQQGKALDVAVVLGGDPILMMASILPLPEDVDEIGFAGFLRGRGVPMITAKTMNMLVPAGAEFILEGKVAPGVRRREGPFGDHFGHYSDASDFPVFQIEAVTRRREPLFPATVVGKPPQEDKFLGIAAGEMIGPLIKIINPNIVDLCAYVGAGFHNLLVVSVHERHPKEVLKTATALLGTGQLALTKVLILVRADQNPRDFRSMLRAMWTRMTPENNLWLIPVAPLDTLDFTSYTMHVGSKLVIDATGEVLRKEDAPASVDPQSIDRRVLRWKLLDGGFLVIVVREQPREVLMSIVRSPLPILFVVAVSDDVDLDDDENLQWGIFTRFDPARDMVFTEQKFVGARPVYSGTIGIDATWKEGYPKPLVMEESIVRRVSARWNDYWA